MHSILRIINQPKLQLFLTSFLLLFLELSLIRFIPAYVRYLGYFTNFILLGSFLGIGIGCLLAKNKKDISIFFPILLLIIMLIIKFYKFEVQITTSQSIFFQSNSGDNRVESFLLLPTIFLLITVIFATLAQKLGKLLASLAPLTAYTFDILGSIAGVVFFTVSSFLMLPALIWFVIFSLLYFLIIPWKKFRLVTTVIFFFITLAIIPTLDDLPIIWSPYQKVAPYSLTNPKREPGKPDTHWRLYVNNIIHQDMTKFEETSGFYKLIYEIFPVNSFSKILIVGAGSGQDANVALKNNVQNVDAVEIDPAIVSMGKKLHPDKPYDNPKVRIIINDARSFLENSSEKYDLVIFALTDSTVLTTSLSSLRLESYLFTTEAFHEVKSHLTSNGLFVLYNYYRDPWLVDKISYMLARTFQQPPLMAPEENNFAQLLIGPKLKDIYPDKRVTLWKPNNLIRPATDDWPFLYLKEASLPNIYLKSLFVITMIGVGLTLYVSRGKILKNFSGDFFFLGAAFLLIETKSIINFNLLFGTTWLVNSLVFIGILTSVLLAIWVNQKWKIKKLHLWIILLLISLFANYAIPIEKFLVANFWLRYFAATVFFFSPIFLANIIFSNLFQRAKNPADNFGVNLLGAFFGGMFEYTSLLWGYHNLILVAVIFYCLAFFFILRRLKNN